LTLNNMASSQHSASGISVSGTLGSGLGTITVETVNGSIKVNGV